MTDEEIQLAAKEIVSELVRYCDVLPEHREYVASKLQRVVRTTYTEAIEEAAKLLDEREAACSKEAQRFADAEEGTDNNMYWRADGASDVLEQCALELRRLVSSSHGETEGEGV